VTGPSPGFSSRRGQKPEGGAKNQKGTHLQNTVLDVSSNQGAKRERRGTDFKWGARHHWPPAGDGLLRDARQYFTLEFPSVDNNYPRLAMLPDK